MAQLIAEEAGVRLEWHDARTTKSGKGGPHFRLTTMRPNAARVFADRDEALAAYEREVTASLQDPVVQEMVRRRS